MSTAWLSTRRVHGWLAFGVLVALNLWWLVADTGAAHDESADVSAYGECRSAIRRTRADAATGVFPTLDLIRVSQSGSARFTVRGFFEDRNRVIPTWYSCGVVRAEDGRWHVENVAFDQQGLSAPSSPQ